MLIHRNRPCAESRRQAHTGDSVAWNGSPAGTPCSARLCTLTTLLQPGPRRGPSSRPAQVAAARGGLSCEPVTELDGSTPQMLTARLASPRPLRAGATQQHSPHPPTRPGWPRPVDGPVGVQTGHPPVSVSSGLLDAPLPSPAWRSFPRLSLPCFS